MIEFETRRPCVSFCHVTINFLGFIMMIVNEMTFSAPSKLIDLWFISNIWCFLRFNLMILCKHFQLVINHENFHYLLLPSLLMGLVWLTSFVGLKRMMNGSVTWRHSQGSVAGQFPNNKYIEFERWHRRKIVDQFKFGFYILSNFSLFLLTSEVHGDWRELFLLFPQPWNYWTGHACLRSTIICWWMKSQKLSIAIENFVILWKIKSTILQVKFLPKGVGGFMVIHPQ